MTTDETKRSLTDPELKHVEGGITRLPGQPVILSKPTMSASKDDIKKTLGVETEQQNTATNV